MTITLKNAVISLLAIALLASMGVLVTQKTNPTTPTTSIVHAAGGSNIYMKFDGVEGESQAVDYEGRGDVSTFSHGLSNGMDGETGSSRRRASSTFEPLTVTKELDKASPKIAEAVANGKVFPTFKLDFTRSTDEKTFAYYSYELTNVIVTSYNVSGSSGERPTESFSLNFEKIKVTYVELDPRTGEKKGNVEFEWSVEKGTK